MSDWLPDGAREWGGRPVARAVCELVPRRRAVLSGAVRAVVVHRSQDLRRPFGPIARAGAFDAWLDDGTGSVVLRWLGRDSVPGIVPDARLGVEGTVSEVGGRLVILNPLYRFEPVS